MKLRTFMCIILLVLTVSAVMADFNKPFGGEEKKMFLDGEPVITIYRRPCEDSASFLFYWQPGMTVPNCSYGKISWFYTTVDVGGKHKGRVGAAWAADPSGIIGASNVPLRGKFKDYPINQAGLLGIVDNGMAVEAWYCFTKVKPYFFKFGVKSEKKKEYDDVKTLIVPVSPVSVEQWVNEHEVYGPVQVLPRGAHPLSEKPSTPSYYSPAVPAQPVQPTLPDLDSDYDPVPFEESKATQPVLVVKEPDLSGLTMGFLPIEAEKMTRTRVNLKGKTLSVTLLDKNGKPFIGNADVRVDPQGKGAKPHIIKVAKGTMNGRALTNGLMTVTSPYFKSLIVEVPGFYLVPSNSNGDSITFQEDK